MKFRILLVITVTLCAACTIEKNTEKAAQTSERIESTSKQIEQATCKVVRLGAEAGSYDHMKAAVDLEGIFNQSVRAGEKLGFAEVAFRALPFQSWDGQCGEDEARLQYYYQDSVNLVFSQIHDRMDDSFPVDAGVLPLQNNEWNGLSALAASMHMLGYDYKINMKRAGLPALSFYDLVIRALNMEDADNRHEKIPEYATKVLQYKGEFIYMLQLRHNALMGEILILATNVEDHEIRTGFKLYHTDNILEVPLVDQLNSSSARVAKYYELMKMAVETRNDLKYLGIPLRLNERFAVSLSKIKWVPPTNLVLAPEVEALQSEFIQTYSEILAENFLILNGADLNKKAAAKKAAAQEPSFLQTLGGKAQYLLGKSQQP